MKATVLSLKGRYRLHMAHTIFVSSLRNPFMSDRIKLSVSMSQSLLSGEWRVESGFGNKTS